MELTLGILQVLAIPVIGVLLGLTIGGIVILWTRMARAVRSRRSIVASPGVACLSGGRALGRALGRRFGGLVPASFAGLRRNVLDPRPPGPGIPGFGT